MLLGLIVVVFFMTHLVGDPVDLMLRPEATEEQRQAVRERLGLNDPILVQFGRFLGGVVRGDFGESIWQRVPALPVVLDRLPATLYLASPRCCSPCRYRSCSASSRRSVRVDRRSVGDRRLAGRRLDRRFLARSDADPALRGPARLAPDSGYGGVQFVILPAVALAFRPLGRISQVVRSAMLDQFSQPYVTTARAKGLTERVVVYLHTLKNAAIPVATLVGDEAASLLNGAVVIETVFGWPGVGILLIQAIERRDLPLIEASVMVIAVMIVTVNLVIDLTYSFLDPRVRYG